MARPGEGTRSAGAGRRCIESYTKEPRLVSPVPLLRPYVTIPSYSHEHVDLDPGIDGLVPRDPVGQGRRLRDRAGAAGRRGARLGVRAAQVPGPLGARS